MTCLSVSIVQNERKHTPNDAQIRQDHSERKYMQKLAEGNTKTATHLNNFLHYSILIPFHCKVPEMP
uniref:Uncharacterized protein n=1 Tax=Anguilla anguilla TaxID=7936 RepID=A0A0E9WUE1_ANGAN